MNDKLPIILGLIACLLGIYRFIIDKEYREKHQYMWQGRKNITLIIIIALLMIGMFSWIFINKKRKQSEVNHTRNDFILVGRETLKDSQQIELLFRAGGATDRDVIWIQKTLNNQKSYIGRIKGDDRYKFKIWQENDSIIKIRLTDTLNISGKFRDFKINLNNRIYPNDGSMYADSTY